MNAIGGCAGNTMVQTSTGFKPIGQIVVGDEVLTGFGKVGTVKEVIKNDLDSLLKVGRSRYGLICTPDTRILCSDKPGSIPVFINACEADHFYTVVIVDIEAPPVPLLPRVRRKGIHGKEVEFFHLLGHWLGDGSLQFNRNDGTHVGYLDICDHRETIEDVANAVRPFKANVAINKGRGNTCSVRLYGDEVVNWVYRNFGRYSHGKFVSSWVLNLPSECRKAFLRGWLEADGYQISNTSWRGSSVSEELICGMLSVAESLDYVASMNKVCCKPNTIEGRRLNNRPFIFTLQVSSHSHQYNTTEMNYHLITDVSTVNETHTVYNLKIEGQDNSYRVNRMVIRGLED